MNEKQIEFLKSKYPYAQKAGDALGVPASFILAQWAHETGYGTNTGTKNNNLAGLWAYPSSSYGSSGKKYLTLDDFVNDYVGFLSKKRYAGIKEADTVTEFAGALSKAGYATDPNYATAKTWTQVDGLFNGGDIPDTSTPQGTPLVGTAGISSVLDKVGSIAGWFEPGKIDKVVTNVSFVTVGIILGLIGIYFLFSDKISATVKVAATNIAEVVI